MYEFDGEKRARWQASKRQAINALLGECSVVCRASTSVPITGDILALFGVPSLLVKTPMQIHIGIAETDAPGIDYGWCRSLNIADAEYEEWHPPSHLSSNIISVVERFLRPWLPSSTGLKLYFLEDIPQGRQNASPIGVGARAAALAAALLVWAQQLTNDDITSWRSIHRFGLAGDRSPQSLKFDSLFRFAWQLASANHNGKESGAEVFSAMLEDEWPCLYFTEARGGSVECPEQGLKPLDISSDYGVLDSIRYWGFRGDNFFNKPEDRPFQYGLVFSGYEQNPLGAIARIIESRNVLRAAPASATRTPKAVLFDEVGVFSENTWVGRLGQDAPSLDAWSRTMLENTANSLKIAELLYGIIETGSSDLDELFRQVDDAHLRLEDLKIVGHGLEDTRKRLTAGHESDIAVKISGKCSAGDYDGGGLFFISRVGAARAMRQRMTQTFDDRPIAHRPRLDYASWESEGYVSDGIVLVTQQSFDSGFSKQSSPTPWPYPVPRQDKYQVARNGPKDSLPQNAIEDSFAKQADFFLWVNEFSGDYLIDGQPAKLTPHEKKLMRLILFEAGPGVIVQHNRVRREIETGRDVNKIYAELADKLGHWWEESLKGERGRGKGLRGSPGKPPFTYCWIVDDREDSARDPK